jgi:molybdopterin/thiamine biosynthesis adenylyltransferase
MKTPKKLKVIGCGGIGGFLADPLVRFIGHSDAYRAAGVSTTLCDVALIDGDKFEHRNSARQHFEETANKAEEKARILRKNHPRIFFRPVPEYLTENNIIMNVREGDVVFCCVDNHTARRLVAERCEELDNVVLISGGNDEVDGNIQIHVREDGVDITPSILKYHPEIQNAEGDNPGDDDVERMGCEQQVDTEPQLLFANQMAANLMNIAFRNWAEDRLDYGEVYFNIDEVAVVKYSLEMRPA